MDTGESLSFSDKGRQEEWSRYEPTEQEKQQILIPDTAQKIINKKHITAQLLSTSWLNQFETTIQRSASGVLQEAPL